MALRSRRDNIALPKYLCTPLFVAIVKLSLFLLWQILISLHCCHFVVGRRVEATQMAHDNQGKELTISFPLPGAAWQDES